jgi:hypothetical protein
MHVSSKFLRPLGIAALVIHLVGCGTLSTPTCAPGQDAATSESLYFGTTKKSGEEVSAGEWQAFLDEVVTPRFPQGLTVFAARGQWKEQSGRILAEATYVLNVVHPGAETQRRAIGEIAAEYKRRFDQESVLRVSSTVCVTF